MYNVIHSELHSQARLGRARNLGQRFDPKTGVVEVLVFHGTAERAAADVLAHQNGLDPRFSNGGFYGQGIYLAEYPSYPIGGRYAHRVSGSGGSRVQLLIVKAALGSQQEMGQRISAETRAMRMPDVRVEGPPRLLYDSVRGGPHRPFVSGGGENGCNASIVHVVYESRQVPGVRDRGRDGDGGRGGGGRAQAVSYTHLTLPTICSV